MAVYDPTNIAESLEDCLLKYAGFLRFMMARDRILICDADVSVDIDGMVASLGEKNVI